MEHVRHKARWVILEPGVCVENGFVEVTDGRVSAGGKARPGLTSRDHGDGVIMPALVNGHCHLSLSALASLAEPGMSFVKWVRELITAREAMPPEVTADSALKAAQSAKQTGTGFLAEVGPLQPGTSAMKQAGIQGVVFLELLGNVSNVPDLPAPSNDLSFSLAGHALHTTHPQALRSLKASAARYRRPFSIHLAESAAETEFLACGRGEWAELLQERGIDFSTWDLRSERPITRANRLGLLGAGTLAVHALDVRPAEIGLLANTGTSACVCPRSNWRLHGRLPDITAFLDAGIPVALGTDSLASAPSLSMFGEMAFVAQSYPGLRPEIILAMASTNAAAALGRPDLGRIMPGQTASLIYVDIDARSHDLVAVELVSASPGLVEWL